MHGRQFELTVTQVTPHPLPTHMQTQLVWDKLTYTYQTPAEEKLTWICQWLLASNNFMKRFYPHYLFSVVLCADLFVNNYLFA